MNPNACPYKPGARIGGGGGPNKENIAPVTTTTTTLCFASPQREGGRVPLRDITPSQFAKPPPLQTKPLEDAARTPARTPSRQMGVMASSEQRSNTKGRSSAKKASRSPVGSPTANDVEEDIRRVDQRSKQIGYGYNTDGYRNMLRLVKSDPCLTRGGVIPLAPPVADVKASKRTWDMLIRKWRRLLHMFDDVFIEGDTADGATMESVQHAQRLRWVSPMHLQFDDSQSGVPTIPSLRSPSYETVMAMKSSPNVPTRMPIEETMQHLLRHPSCYEPVTSVIPDSLLYHSKGAQFSPTDIGIKVVVAPSSVPSQYASARSPSPEAPDFAPTATLTTKDNTTSPRRCASPNRGGQGSSADLLSPTRKLETTCAGQDGSVLMSSSPTTTTPHSTPSNNKAQLSTRRYRAIVPVDSETPARSHQGASPFASSSSPVVLPTVGMMPFPGWMMPYWPPNLELNGAGTSPSASPSVARTSLSAAAPHFTPNLLKSKAAAKTATAASSLSPSGSPSNGGGPSLSPQMCPEDTDEHSPQHHQTLDTVTTVFPQ